MQPTVLTPLKVLWRRRALERSCHWTRHEIESHQQRQLAELRRFALAHSPFYQRFHQGLSHAPLHELPVLTKPVMMEHFDEFLTDREVRLADAERFLAAPSHERSDLFRNRYVVLSTSGSTGRRGIFLFDRAEWLTALAMITRPLAWAGVNPSLFRKPARSAMITSTTPWHYSARVSSSLATRLLPSLRLDAATPLETMVARLNEWKPEVLGVYPSVLKQLAEEQLAGRLRIELRTIATSAEVLPQETRRIVHRAWRIPVFETYGATEYAPIAAECPFGRKHLFEDGAIIEIVDAQARPVAPGESGERVLLTIFSRRTQPLIRYEISDMVRPVAGECECGRKLRLIESIAGRVEDVLEFPARDGRSANVAVHPILFHNAFESAPATGWQVRQEDDNGLTVALAQLRDAAALEPLERSLRSALEARGAIVGTIRVRAVDALERGATGKTPFILGKRK